MNKKLLLTLWFLLTCFSMAKAEIVQLGSGERISSSGPYCDDLNYSLTHQIYSSLEINHTGTIVSLAFKVENDATPRNIDVYLVETSRTDFGTDNTAYNPVLAQESDRVFSGTVTCKAGEWMTITLDKPFDYHCQKNLCVIVNDVTGSSVDYYTTSSRWYVYEGINQSLTRYNDTAGPYNPASPASTATTTVSSVTDLKCQLQLGFAEGTPGPYTTVLVGEGNLTHTTLPSHTGHDHSYSQQIYYPSEIGHTGVITHLAFFAKECKSIPVRTFDIYLMETTKNSFNSKTDYLVPSESDKVFSGTAEFSLGEWTTIKLDTPFQYGGRKNLCVIMNDKTGHCRYKAEWLAYTGDSGSSLSWYGLYNTYNPQNPYEADDISAYKNQVQFTFGESETKEIGYAQSSQFYLPTFTCSYYSLTQQIYTKEELWSTGHDITSVSFYNVTSHAQTRNLDIYLVPTSKTAFSDSNDWIDFTEADKVFSGTVTFGQNCWTAIPFRKSVWYNGRDNVALIVDDNTEESQLDVQFSTFSTTTKQAIWVNSNNINYTADGLSSYPGVRETEKNHIIFNETGIDPKPYDLTVSDIDYQSANISWKSAGSKWNLQYKDAEASTWTDIKGLLSPRRSLRSLAEETTYDVRVQTVNADGTYSDYVSTQFTTPQRFPRPTDVTVESITPTSAVLDWTENGEARKWLIYVNNTQYTAESKPFTLTELQQGQTYTVVVQPIVVVDGQTYEGNRSELVSFTTPLVNPLPVITSITNITPWSATITWEGKSDYYEVEYTEDMKHWFGTQITYEKTMVISGLKPDTDYDVRVVGFMEGEEDAKSEMEWFVTLASNPVPFDIAVEPLPTSAHISWTGYGERYTLLYREVHEGGMQTNFYDNFEYGFDDKGWTVYTEGDVVPGKEGWYVTNSGETMAACSSSWYLSSNNTDVGINADNWLVSPLVNLGGTLKYREWIRGDYPDTYEVRLSTTGKAISDFTTILRPMATGRDGWTYEEIDLSAYAGRQGYIAIHHQSSDQFMLYIDNFGIYQTIPEYGEWYGAKTGATEYTLEDLTPETKYELKIVSNKSGDPAATAEGIFFTTLNTPDQIVLDDNGDNTRILSASEGRYANVTINNRTFTKDGTWQGICLPFDVDVEKSVLAGADVRTLESMEQRQNYVIMNCLTPVTKMKAGTPYIIKWDNGQDIVNPVFEGVVIDLTDRDVYPMDGTEIGVCNRTAGPLSNVIYSFFESINNEEWICLMNGTPVLTPVTAGCTVHAFDIMFNVMDIYTDDTVVVLYTGNPDELAVGVSSLRETEEGAAIYNLAGQRLSKMQRGINIVNGKKVLVK